MFYFKVFKPLNICNTFLNQYKTIIKHKIINQQQKWKTTIVLALFSVNVSLNVSFFKMFVSSFNVFTCLFNVQ